MQSTIIAFPRPYRLSGAGTPEPSDATAAHAGRESPPDTSRRVSRCRADSERLELTIIRLLGRLMQDRERQCAVLRRLSFQLHALGLDADPTVVAGLRHAIHAVSMLVGARPATDRLDAARKCSLFADLPVCGETHVAVALVACIEADRVALGLTPADLA